MRDVSIAGLLTVCCNFMGLEKNKEMGTNKIQVDLIKLTSGERLLRLTDLPSGLSLEKKVDPSKPVIRQKNVYLAHSKQRWHKSN